MDKFKIVGGRPLTGEIPVSGSKNSALPALAAALLTDEPVILRRIPRVRDIRTMQRLLVDIGATGGGNGWRRSPAHAAHRLPGSALRSGEDDAGVQPGVWGRSGGAFGARARLTARRLRHRLAAYQFAHLRPGTAGRQDQPVAWIHRS